MAAPKDRATDPKRQPKVTETEVNPALLRSFQDLRGMDTEAALKHIQRWKDTFGNK